MIQDTHFTAVELNSWHIYSFLAEIKVKTSVPNVVKLLINIEWKGGSKEDKLSKEGGFNSSPHEPNDLKCCMCGPFGRYNKKTIFARIA